MWAFALCVAYLVAASGLPMSDLVKVAIIAASASMFSAILVAAVGIWSHRKTRAAVEAIHVQINSRMDEWLKSAMELARREAVDSERDRVKETEKP